MRKTKMSLDEKKLNDDLIKICKEEKKRKIKKMSEFEVSLNQYKNGEINTYNSFEEFKKAMEN